MTYRSPRYARIVAGLALLFVAQAQAQEPAPPAADEDLKKLATEVYAYPPRTWRNSSLWKSRS